MLAARLKRGSPDGPPGPWVLLAAWGPCGYAPLAPGTAGTLGAIVALAAHAAERAGRYWKVADASPIVIDEVAGYLVTMALVPWSWPAALLGAALFRVFDVLKPWPASALDGWKSGFGVVLDDVAAGAFAWAALVAIELGLQIFLGCEGRAHWFCAEVGR